jgi:hypothetical protein
MIEICPEYCNFFVWYDLLLERSFRQFMIDE